MKVNDESKRIQIGPKLFSITLNAWNDTTFIIFRLFFIELWLTAQNTPYRTEAEIMLRIRLIKVIESKFGNIAPVDKTIQIEDGEVILIFPNLHLAIEFIVITCFSFLNFEFSSNLLNVLIHLIISLISFKSSSVSI